MTDMGAPPDMVDTMAQLLKMVLMAIECWWIPAEAFDAGESVWTLI